ncbi:RNA-guided pseudouridylation complex pseudouridine synthase subunit Cbf5 [Methanobrevibacter sp. TMH8]|uniref:RNA-guided pseudouridylation complex pseudouridine synthase subunit Cbf5 n=1 Tax=Methanobrevibacter sp. TMH8 TaxID=2848611 RepID=UPI001CCF7056|nr:RNA-guided pseudouridylation complex pseudouridine synthase subunit Cbf5 [Methanobrevibacter sp. TMH8]MBZ9571578.1 RNA-guided pseudouridylation complex pseudouridine synthase subunit Cbf5 [Methanobrevibacter sp. TMH8]
MKKLLIKSEGNTDPKYGSKPKDRSIEEHISKGVINLDKPSGPTSHEIDSWVKRILNVEKTGHGGTLDPKVTGVLPIGIDSATRVIQLLLAAPKEYVCLLTFHKDVSEENIRSIFDEFQGKIYQTPPVKSAVKRELRVRTIYYTNILEIDGRDVLFKIGCEAGTYVRTYCHDIGEALGTGAHMSELRRTQVGSFTEDNNLITLQDLTDAFYYWDKENDESYLRKCILPMESATEHLPKVFIRDSAVDAICHGADLAVGGVLSLSEDVKKGDTVVIFTLKGELVASAQALLNAEEILTSSSGIVFDTKKVFMGTGIYPMMWK